MQAVILAGGEGTRLRPLTSTIPKPVVPLGDRPFIVHMLEWLKGHGVDDVVLSCGHLASGVRNVLGDGEGVGMRLRYVEEAHPLGTAGPVKLAEPLLDERFLVLNGDVLTDLDVTAQLAAHEASGAKATLALIGVEDPSAYGLVRLNDAGAVREFVEKPPADQIDTNLINAGCYVLEREVLDAIAPDTKTSFEREVFPALIGNGLYGFPQQGYWLDIGTPERYLEATFDILEQNVDTAVGRDMGAAYLSVPESVESGGRVVPPALVEESVTIAEGARVGSLAVLGHHVRVGAGAVVERAVVLQGAEIGEGAVVRDCIVAAGARIGDHTIVDGGAVIGEGVVIGPHNHLSCGARVFPGVELPDGGIRF
jgi:mannose-1-phosphate guanylyltransferase